MQQIRMTFIETGRNFRRAFCPRREAHQKKRRRNEKKKKKIRKKKQVSFQILQELTETVSKGKYLCKGSAEAKFKSFNIWTNVIPHWIKITLTAIHTVKESCRISCNSPLHTLTLKV